MKNAFFILLTGLLLSSSVQAQKKKSSAKKPLAVPENVNVSFKSIYTVADDNKWDKNYSGNYVAHFTNAENRKQTVEFSESGALIKSKTEFPADSLPENINSSITSQYPDTKIVEAAKYQMPGVAPYYKVQVLAGTAKKELLISEEGTITE